MEHDLILFAVSQIPLVIVVAIYLRVHGAFDEQTDNFRNDGQ